MSTSAAQAEEELRQARAREQRGDNEEFYPEVHKCCIYRKLPKGWSASRIQKRASEQPLTRQEELEITRDLMLKVNFKGKPIDIEHGDSLVGRVVDFVVDSNDDAIAHFQIFKDGRKSTVLANELLSKNLIKGVSATTTEHFTPYHVLKFTGQRIALCCTGARDGAVILGKENVKTYNERRLRALSNQQQEAAAAASSNGNKPGVAPAPPLSINELRNDVVLPNYFEKWSTCSSCAWCKQLVMAASADSANKENKADGGTGAAATGGAGAQPTVVPPVVPAPSGGGALGGGGGVHPDLAAAAKELERLKNAEKALDEKTRALDAAQKAAADAAAANKARQAEYEKAMLASQTEAKNARDMAEAKAALERETAAKIAALEAQLAAASAAAARPVVQVPLALPPQTQAPAPASSHPPPPPPPVPQSQSQHQHDPMTMMLLKHMQEMQQTQDRTAQALGVLASSFQQQQQTTKASKTIDEDARREREEADKKRQEAIAKKQEMDTFVTMVQSRWREKTGASLTTEQMASVTTVLASHALPNSAVMDAFQDKWSTFGLTLPASSSTTKASAAAAVSDKEEATAVGGKRKSSTDPSKLFDEEHDDGTRTKTTRASGNGGVGGVAKRFKSDYKGPPEILFELQLARDGPVGFVEAQETERLGIRQAELPPQHQSASMTHLTVNDNVFEALTTTRRLASENPMLMKKYIPQQMGDVLPLFAEGDKNHAIRNAFDTNAKARLMNMAY